MSEEDTADYSPEAVFHTEQPEPESLPAKIEVVGAGTPEVNGVYVLMDLHEDDDSDNDIPTHYSKAGTWKGKPVTFRVVHIYEEMEWVIEMATDEGYGSGLIFYGNDGVCDDEAVYYERVEDDQPSQTGWKVSFLSGNKGCIDATGKEPVPIILRGGESLKDWRLDPKDSFSDWTIRISAEDEDIKSLPIDYHVHLDTIALGDQSSGYFRQLARSKGFAENQTKLSEITLHRLAADQFPVMLDYTYGRDLRINEYNAVVLLYLARYFDCPTMLKEVSSACASSFKHSFKSAAGPFFKCATALGMSDIVRAIEKHCVDKFDELSCDHSIVQLGNPSFWLSVLSKVSITDKRSMHASTLVAEVCKKEEDDVNKTLFDQLTDHLTLMSASAAIPLLEMGIRFGSIPNDSSPLQEECLRALADSLGTNSNPKAVKFPENFPVAMFNELLALTNQSVKTRLAKRRRDED